MVSVRSQPPSQRLHSMSLFLGLVVEGLISSFWQDVVARNITAANAMKILFIKDIFQKVDKCFSLEKVRARVWRNWCLTRHNFKKLNQASSGGRFSNVMRTRKPFVISNSVVSLMSIRPFSILLIFDLSTLQRVASWCCVRPFSCLISARCLHRAIKSSWR